MSTSKSEFIQLKWRIVNFWLNMLIATVWIVNGLYAKVLGGVPRHQMIVARILGDTWSDWITTTIGMAELVMAAWILIRLLPRVCALTQVVVVLLMNVLEIAVARDLLLFGGINLVWAVIFCCLVGLNEFIIRPRTVAVQQDN